MTGSIALWRAEVWVTYLQTPDSGTDCNDTTTASCSCVYQWHQGALTVENLFCLYSRGVQLASKLFQSVEV